MDKIKNALKQITRRQWVLIAYLPVHLLWFWLMSVINVHEYIAIYSPLDDLIPFCEWFVFPYLSWFLYMLVPGFYFLARDNEAFEKYLLSLFIGFFISMAIITIWTSGQELRVAIDPGKNIATRIVAFIYGFDSNQNVLPSMHIVGATSVVYSVARAKTLKKKVWLQILNWLLYLAISASTVFLKQHSILDVFSALGIEIAVIIFVYTGVGVGIFHKIVRE